MHRMRDGEWKIAKAVQSYRIIQAVNRNEDMLLWLFSFFKINLASLKQCPQYHQWWVPPIQHCIRNINRLCSHRLSSFISRLYNLSLKQNQIYLYPTVLSTDDIYLFPSKGWITCFITLPHRLITTLETHYMTHIGHKRFNEMPKLHSASIWDRPNFNLGGRTNLWLKLLRKRKQWRREMWRSFSEVPSMLSWTLGVKIINLDKWDIPQVL